MKSLMILFVLLVFLSTVAAKETIVTPNASGVLQLTINAADLGDVLLLQAGAAFPNLGSVIIDKPLTIRSIGNTDVLGNHVL